MFERIIGFIAILFAIENIEKKTDSSKVLNVKRNTNIEVSIFILFKNK